MTLADWAWKHWQRRGVIAWTLRPLSLLYGGLVALYARRQRVTAAGLRTDGAIVIVVGNRTVGGSGKTPMVAWIAEYLSGKGYSVGIVTRGYGRTDRYFHGLIQDSDDPLKVGDEPLFLAHRTRLPVCVDADRVRGVRELVASGCQIIVSDDGLQHHRLQADLRVLMIDGLRRFGNGWCLPAGPLREPLSAVQPAHFTLCLGGTARGAEIPVEMPGSDWVYAVDGSGKRLALVDLAGTRVHAVAGVANPERFFAELEAVGVQVIRHPFPDHYRFQPGDLVFEHGLPVLMTEKDAVKCGAFADPRCWYRPLDVCPDPGFAALLVGRVRALIHAKNLEKNEMDKRLLDILVCPVTKGPLQYDRAANELISLSAGLAYPIRDEIPVMLEDEARVLSDDEKSRWREARPAL